MKNFNIKSIQDSQFEQAVIDKIDNLTKPKGSLGRLEELAKQIDAYSGRGSTILKGMGSYSRQNKDVVMCACNNKQMYTIKKMVHKLDPKAFTIIMESNEVVGEGFKEELGELE